MSKTSVQLFFAPIEHNESRLFKSCNSLISLGLVNKIHIIGYQTPELEQEEVFSENIYIHRVPIWNKKYKINNSLLRKLILITSFLRYNIFAFFKCIKIKPNYISCHNLVLLPISCIIKFVLRIKLIYEPHELETQKAGMSEKGRKISFFIEKYCIKYCSALITVCDPISNNYIETYNIDKLKVFTIHNVPINPNYGHDFLKKNYLREEFNIPNDAIIFIYQGVIGSLRGIRNYLDTFAKLGNKHHLVLMGFGDEVDLVKEYDSTHCNIHYKQGVSVDKIIEYSSSADIGMIVIPGNLSLSYQYSLPNKFYEYAIAGLHICVSDNLSYMSSIVLNDNLGTVIPSNDDGLYNWIINSRHDLISNHLITSLKNRKYYGWQNEEKTFIEVYKYLH